MSRDAVLELAASAEVDPEELLEYWNERAAIREIDGGQSREDAERDAVGDLRDLLAHGRWMLGDRKGPRRVDGAPADARDRGVR